MASSSGSRSPERSRRDRKLVLLDEPFSSLDAALRATVRAEVTRLLRAAGTTALLVTHDQDEALSLADHVAVIRDGRIGQSDTPRVLYDAPVDAELARFVGEANLIPGMLLNGSVRTAFGDLVLQGSELGSGQGSGAAVVLIRPEQVRLHETGRGVPVSGRIVQLRVPRPRRRAAGST